MKQLGGIVTSTKMAKTAVVLVSRLKIHPLYKKMLRRKKKYLVDNTIGAKEGERVKISLCRPLSKRKRWTITQIMEKKR